MSCLYNILGVAETASEIEIRQADRKLAVQSPPQTTGAAVEECKRITNAYEILVDDRKRAAYDLIRSNESEPRQREPQKQSNAGQSNRGGYTKSSQSRRRNRRKRRAAAALRFLRRVCVGFLKFTAQVIVEAVANFDFVDCFVDLVD